MKRLFISLAALLLSSFRLEAQGQSQQNSSDQTSPSAIHSTVQETVLDMVFRDRKGKAIRDIRPEEIHILEDGVEQNLISFRLVEGNAASLATPASSAPGSISRVDRMRE